MGDHTMTSLHAATTVRSRQPASGPCRCSRRTCWHHGACRASGVVRVYRAGNAPGEPPPAVVLCRECAAPSQRTRVA